MVWGWVGWVGWAVVADGDGDLQRGLGVRGSVLPGRMEAEWRQRGKGRNGGLE